MSSTGSQSLSATAYYALGAMSGRALAYSEEPLAADAHPMKRPDDRRLRLPHTIAVVRLRPVRQSKNQGWMLPVDRAGRTDGLDHDDHGGHLTPRNETRLLSIPVTDTRIRRARFFQALSQERTILRMMTRPGAHSRRLETAESRVVVLRAPPGGADFSSGDSSPTRFHDAPHPD